MGAEPQEDLSQDAFQDAFDAPSSPRGAFRTAEPTREERLRRAREASFERVRRITSAQLAAQERSARRLDRAAYLALASGVIASLAVVGLAVAGDSTWIAWSCPATALLASTSMIAWRRGRRAAR